MFKWHVIGCMAVIAGLCFAGVSPVSGDPKYGDQEAGGGDEHAVKPVQLPENPDLERLKAMAGTWVGTFASTHEGNEPKPATVTYSVTAGGSVVVETLFPGTPHEMVSVYHLDGEDLVMTHYCMLGNQPRMIGVADDNPRKMSMRCDGSGTNIPDEDAPHMHATDFEFDGDDHAITDWIMYQDGEPAGKGHLDVRRKID